MNYHNYTILISFCNFRCPLLAHSRQTRDAEGLRRAEVRSCSHSPMVASLKLARVNRSFRPDIGEKRLREHYLVTSKTCGYTVCHQTQTNHFIRRHQEVFSFQYRTKLFIKQSVLIHKHTNVQLDQQQIISNPTARCRAINTTAGDI